MKDLSNLIGNTGNALVGGESSSGSNTVNHPVTSIGAAPGSMPVNLPHDGPEDNTMDSPALEIPVATKHKGVTSTSSATSTASTWKKAGD